MRKLVKIRSRALSAEHVDTHPENYQGFVAGAL
jgi:hypothetical protein